jgi:hypothetical protein
VFVVWNAAGCGAIALVFIVLFGVAPVVLDVLGGSVVFGFRVIVAPLVSKYVHPLFVV